MPDYSKLKNVVYEANPTGQGMSFAQVRKMRIEQKEAKEQAKNLISKQINKLRRPDTPLAETPEPKKYQ